jgi:hypothetical protein
MECGCSCHTNPDGRPSGHDGLCCEFPNGLRKNNPYKKLLPASVYRQRIEEWEKECEEEEKLYFKTPKPLD